MTRVVEVPEPVRRKVRALGTDGERWLRDLGHLVAELEAEWGLDVGAAIAGGSGGFVARATAADGAEVVLKVAIPDGLEGHGPFARELQTLQLGEGHGYVRVLHADVDRRAMVQEGLGRPLAALGLAVEAQIAAIAATVAGAWQPLPAATPLRTGAQQANYLGEFIQSRWESLGRPCPAATVEVALRYAGARHDAFDASAAVLIHGDAHPANVLEDPRTAHPSAAFKLIDPDGMRSEPAHDLAIPLRDWTDELLAADPVELGVEWCHRLGDAAAADPRLIWEWAFVERVSTGLFLLQLGDARGARFLEVANEWSAVTPRTRL